MSRTVVRASAFLLAISLALMATRAFADKPAKKPAPVDDPFGGEDSAPAGQDPFGGAKPGATKKLGQPPKGGTPAHLHGGEKAILKALKQKTSLNFTDTALKEVLDYLSRKHRIPIVLDTSGLKDAGVDPGQQISCNVSGISLQSALQIILDELQLKWAIHNEVLMITSPTKAESDEFMYTKVYDVTDLVMPVPDTSIPHNPLSTPDATSLDDHTRLSPAFPNPTVMGSGMAGVGSVPTVTANVGVGPRVVPAFGVAGGYSAARMDFQALMDLIQNTVATKSWIDNGGNGPISDFPALGCLAISQTREVHQEIERLLADLRRRQRAQPSFHVELQWLWLDAAHRNALFASGKQAPGLARKTIDTKRLSQVSREVPRFHAITKCLNAQNAAVSAGDRRAMIANAIPALDTGISYQPVVSMPNIGVMAEVTPILQRGEKSARLTVRSTITRWTPGRRPALVRAAWSAGNQVNVDSSPRPGNASTTPPVSLGGGFMEVASEDVTAVPSAVPSAAPPATLPAVVGQKEKPAQPPTPNAQNAAPATAHATISSHGGGSASCPIDLPVMPTQEFGTTLRVPLGKPVVVGSITFAPAGDAGVGAAKTDPVEVYLIATVSVVKKAKKKP